MHAVITYFLVFERGVGWNPSTVGTATVDDATTTSTAAAAGWCVCHDAQVADPARDALQGTLNATFLRLRSGGCAASDAGGRAAVGVQGV